MPTYTACRQERKAIRYAMAKRPWLDDNKQTKPKAPQNISQDMPSAFLETAQGTLSTPQPIWSRDAQRTSKFIISLSQKPGHMADAMNSCPCLDSARSLATELTRQWTGPMYPGLTAGVAIIIT